MSDDLTPHDFRILRQMMPGIKREASRKQIEQARKRIDPNARFCPICTNKILVVSKEPSGNCIDCDKKLKKGMTAIVSMDGRHMWITSDGNRDREKDLFVLIVGKLPDNWTEDFTIQGCMLPTENEKMNKLTHLFKKLGKLFGDSETQQTN